MPTDPKHLQQLLDDDQINELLSQVTLDEIADAWCRYQERQHFDGVEDDDPDWWAVELLIDINHYLKADELRVRAILDLLVDRAASDDVLDAVGAGPLEDFVKGADEDRLRWNRPTALVGRDLRTAR